MPVSLPVTLMDWEFSLLGELYPACIGLAVSWQVTESVCPKGVGHLCLWGMGAYEKCCDQKNNYFHLAFYCAVIKQMLKGDGLGGVI